MSGLPYHLGFDNVEPLISVHITRAFRHVDAA